MYSPVFSPQQAQQGDRAASPVVQLSAPAILHSHEPLVVTRILFELWRKRRDCNDRKVRVNGATSQRKPCPDHHPGENRSDPRCEDEQIPDADSFAAVPIVQTLSEPVGSAVAYCEWPVRTLHPDPNCRISLKPVVTPYGLHPPQ